jgi:hypothetical protein
MMTKKKGTLKPAATDYVVIPLFIEHLISNICGSSYGHGLVGGKTIKYWREICAKLVKHLERYIDVNLDTDKLHRRRIEFQIAQLQEALNKKVHLEREPRLIGAFLTICLLLLGDTPNHYNKKTVNRPEYFRLKGFRTVLYHQTPFQKVALVLKEAENGAIEGVKPDEARHFRRQAQKLGSRKFLNWLQTEHPKAYQNLF